MDWFLYDNGLRRGRVKETLLTSNPISRDVTISWVIDDSWLMQESPDWKPEWLLDMGL